MLWKDDQLHRGREVIKTILKHLSLWVVKGRPVPKAHTPPPAEYVMDDYQLPMNDNHLYQDPDYPGDTYIES